MEPRLLGSFPYDREAGLSIQKVQFWLLILMSLSFHRTLEKLDYNRSTNVSGKGMGKPSLFIFIWIKFSSLVWSWTSGFCSGFPSNVCLGCRAKLQRHQLTSHALPHAFPAYHITFYLNHFQILSSEQTCAYPMIGPQHNQVMFVHVFFLFGKNEYLLLL